MTSQIFVQAIKTYPTLSLRMRTELEELSVHFSDNQKAMILDMLEETSEEFETDLDGAVLRLLVEQRMIAGDAR